MWIDREKYISHIKDTEKIIKMRQLLDKIQIVLNNHILETTDFLDPYERKLAVSVLNRFPDINYLEYGGYNDAERKIIIIFPDYFAQDNIMKGVSIFRVDGSLDLMNHRDYLGALLNLGIVRDKIGDILVHDDFGFIMVMEEISDYIQYNFEKVGNTKIKIKSVNEEDIVIPKTEFKEIKKFLTSLRLDVIISGAYNLSRKKSNSLVKAENVKLNWETINKSYVELEPGDIVSVRGYGRFILHNIEGKSKKGRLMCIIRILI